MEWKVGNDYIVKVSNRKHKKYDVFFKNKYLLSFGDTRYQHYYDKFMYYSHLNHLDLKRREKYRERHRSTNKDNPKYSAYWSWWYLW